MSVLLALAIIVAIIAVVCAVKAVRVTATKSVAATTATEPHADEQSAVDITNQDCMEAVVMVLAYTKASLKEERLNGRRARARAWHIRSCASKEAARKARKDAMGPVAAANRRAVAAAECRKALARAHKAPAATYGDITVSAGIKAAWRTKHPVAKVVTKVVKVVGAGVSKPAVARTYVRHAKAANKPILSGTQLAQQARATGTNLAAQISVAKTTLASLYAILPLARQVVALQNKASRKIGLYTWLADEGHVGIRATKSSVARRDAAQEVVCQAALAAEAFKDAYGIEAQDVVSQILVVKATKARAVEMLRNHKAEQHRLFIERQERRAAKAALKASKATTAPAAAKTVTEVADWEQYAPANSSNKSIAFGILHAKGSTMAEKISASLAIVGASHEYGLVSCQTADAAYMVAA